MSNLPSRRGAKTRERDRKTLLAKELRQMPLLPGENEASYEHMLTQVIADVDPQDALEEFWVEDIVYNAWETRFLRRCLREVQRAAALQQLTAVLEPRLGGEAVKALIEAWQRGEPSAVREVQEHLAALGTTAQAVATFAVTTEIGAAYEFDALIACKEVRRNNALRELDRHREALAARTRRAIEKIEDAEFEALPPDLTAPLMGDERLKRYADQP
jgi:hypothetical protein